MNTLEKLEYNNKIKEALRDFCESDVFNPQACEKSYQYLCDALQTGDIYRRWWEAFQLLIDYHLKRRLKAEPFEVFMNQIWEIPMVRIGLLPILLPPAEYAFIEYIALQNDITVQACADQLYSHKREAELNFSKEGHLLQWYLFYDTWKLKPFIFRDFGLLKLKKLALSGYPEKVLDTTGLGNQIIKVFSCSASPVHHIQLGGELHWIEISVCQELETVDVTKAHLQHLTTIKIEFSPSNVVLRCTETQYQYASCLRKVRVQKERITSTTAELHQYAMCDDGENGTKFLEWVIKQPNCDKGTALRIYWKGQPAYFTQFTPDEAREEAETVGDGIYKLLSQIEKRVKKNFYQTNHYPFDCSQDDIQYPTKVVTPIPTYMFKT